MSVKKQISEIYTYNVHVHVQSKRKQISEFSLLKNIHLNTRN